MDDGLLSIILFAVVAAFLVFRLRSALGKRTGYEQQRHDPRLSTDASEQSPAENVLHMPQQRDIPEAEPSSPDSPLAAGITQIKVHAGCGIGHMVWRLLHKHLSVASNTSSPEQVCMQSPGSAAVAVMVMSLCPRICENWYNK